MEVHSEQQAELAEARRILEADGYTVHARSPGPGLYLARMAPDADGDTSPGSPWDHECEEILADVRDALAEVRVRVEWSDDDLVIGEE